MTPAQYAANFWSLRVFLTDKATGDAPAAVPMALPDPKHPLAKPAPPLEPGRWNNFRVDRYRLRPSGYAQHLAQALRNQFAIGVRVINLDGSIGTYSVSPVDIAYSVVAPCVPPGGRHREAQVRLPITAVLEPLVGRRVDLGSFFHDRRRVRNASG